MIRILIDENLSEYFAEGINQLQHPLNNGIEVTSIVKEYHKGIKDEDWIPHWGNQNGIFITQDINIYKTRHQAALLKQYNLGAFFLDVPKNYRYWDKVELLIRKWPQIVDLIKTTEPPFTFFIKPKSIQEGS